MGASPKGIQNLSEKTTTNKKIFLQIKFVPALPICPT